MLYDARPRGSKAIKSPATAEDADSLAAGAMKLPVLRIRQACNLSLQLWSSRGVKTIALCPKPGKAVLVGLTPTRRCW